VKFSRWSPADREELVE